MRLDDELIRQLDALMLAYGPKKVREALDRLIDASQGKERYHDWDMPIIDASPARPTRIPSAPAS